MLTGKLSTKGQIVVPLELRRRARARPGDAFEFIEGDEPNVIIMKRIGKHANEGLVDALLACPHEFELQKPRSEHPKRRRL